MFGNSNGAQAQQPGRPRASDVARIDGTLTQVILGDDPTDAHVFVNGSPIAAGNFDSLTVEIVAPSGNGSGTISGIMSSYQAGEAVPEGGGGRTAHSTSLFPGTVDVVYGGRRVVIAVGQLNSFDGLWLGVGTRPDGSVTEVDGVQAFRLAVTSTFVDASLTWSDTGSTEPLLASAT